MFLSNLGQPHKQTWGHHGMFFCERLFLSSLESACPLPCVPPGVTTATDSVFMLTELEVAWSINLQLVLSPLWSGWWFQSQLGQMEKHMAWK